MIKAENNDIDNDAGSRENSLKSANINQENELVQYNLTQQKEGSLENHAN